MFDALLKKIAKERIEIWLYKNQRSLNQLKTIFVWRQQKTLKSVTNACSFWFIQMLGRKKDLKLSRIFLEKKTFRISANVVVMLFIKWQIVFWLVKPVF